MARHSQKEPRILIVEENEYHGLLMERQISRRLEASSVVLTSSPDEALRFARLEQFDVAVVDFALSECDGLGFLKSLHQVDPGLSVIVVAEEITEAMTREVFRRGCREILVKDSSYYLVIPRMVAGLVCRDQISETQVADRCRLKKGTATCLAESLLNEIGTPVDIILNTATQIMDKVLDDKILADKVSAIRKSAVEIKSSLNALGHRCESDYQSTSWAQDASPVKLRSRVKSLV